MDRRQQYRLEHQALGLCVNCPLPVSGNTRQCAKHREYDRLRNTAKNLKFTKLYRETRRCVRCGCPLEEAERGTCTNCREHSSRKHRRSMGWKES